MSAPESDEAPAAGTAQGFQESTRDEWHSASAQHSTHDLHVNEGEEYAKAYLYRLHAGTATPGELAVILAFLGGDLLHGACRVIEKALGDRHA